MAKEPRDMTQAEFDRACERYGFERGMLGYYHLADTPVSVCVLNAGLRRRDRLAYLIREYEKAKKRFPKSQPGV